MAEAMAIFWLIISDFGGSPLRGRLREGEFWGGKVGAGGRSDSSFSALLLFFWWLLLFSGGF